MLSLITVAHSQAGGIISEFLAASVRLVVPDYIFAAMFEVFATSASLPWILLATIFGGAVGWGLCQYASRGKWQHKLQQAEAQGGAEAAQQLAVLKEQHAEQLSDISQRNAALTAQVDMQSQQLAEQGQQLQQSESQLAKFQADFAASQARMHEMQKSFSEKEAVFAQNSALLKKEFELLAKQVLDQQETKQQQSLQLMLKPFREQIGEFKQRVEEVHKSDVKERASLLTEMQNLQKASERINTEAENLTKALKGDKKLQGNWGELVLERVLEDSGLRKDHEYFVQFSARDEDGQLKRPDVLIRLPEGKDVIVDAKVTLSAYERALASEDEEQREVLLRQHLLDLRNQIKRLSSQDYDQLPDVRSLDFVLLFVPIESAFSIAMEMDPGMFTAAFEQRIMLVSPTTLMLALRIINNLWRVEKQNKNALEIAQRAGAMYDKLAGVVEEVDKLGKQLATVQGTYDNVHSRLATGRGNLVRQVETIKGLGANTKKTIATSLLENSQDDE